MRRPVLSAAALLAPALALALSTAACSDPSQELAVRFRVLPGSAEPDATLVAAARSACPGSVAVRQKPVSRSRLASEKAVPLRYDVTGSSDRDVALIEGCLQRLPGVEAFYLQRRSG